MSARFSTQERSVIAGAPLQATKILERVASTEERAEYRRFVLALAEAAAHAAHKGGVLGRHRATQTDAERDALRSITAILDR
jgi:hypothetical protein